MRADDGEEFNCGVSSFIRDGASQSGWSWLKERIEIDADKAGGWVGKAELLPSRGPSVTPTFGELCI